MAAGKKQYVYRLMKAECSCGSKDFKQNLNLPLDHGVSFQGDDSPLMNANDHVANEHILTFGRCTSAINPGSNAGAMLAGAVLPVIGAILAKKLAGCKCEPMTIVPWIKVDEDYFIDGAPALTIESRLPCFYGGVIKIVLEKEDTDNSDDDDSGDDEQQEEKKEERKDAKKQLPSEVQEKIDSFCDDEASSTQSAAEEALSKEQEGITSLFEGEMPAEITYNENIWR